MNRRLKDVVAKHGAALAHALDPLHVGPGWPTHGVQAAMKLLNEIADAARADAVDEVLGPSGIKVADYERLMLNAVTVELDGTRFVVHLNRAEDAGYLRAWIAAKGGKAEEGRT